MTATGNEDSAAPRGAAFYDDPAVFERYNEPRRTLSDPTDVMEEPALLQEIGDAHDLRIVDLGCGDGAIGRVLLDAGCRRYLGVDGSATMIQAARTTLRGTAGEVTQTNIEDFHAPSASFDLVLSRLALHYVADIDAVLRACHDCLAAGGRLILTVIHPVISSHDARPNTDQPRSTWVVDDYFNTGPRPQNWLGGTVDWHHRTIEDHFAAMRDAGFAVTGLRECPPEPARLEDRDELTRRRRIPMFLLLAGTRA